MILVILVLLWVLFILIALTLCAGAARGDTLYRDALTHGRSRSLVDRYRRRR